MRFISVSELKQSRTMWDLLDKETELVLTKDGKPGAVIIGISPENMESTIAAVRRALFSAAVTSARQRAAKSPLTATEIEHEIQESRKHRAE